MEVFFIILEPREVSEPNRIQDHLHKINREKIVCTILLFNLDLNLFINKFWAQLVYGTSS